MNSTSQWLKAPEISPVLLALNLSRLDQVHDCEAAGRFAAEFEHFYANDTTTLPLRSLAIWLHSYPNISLTNVTLGQLGDWLFSLPTTDLQSYPYPLNISRVAHRLFSIAQDACHDEFCRNIGWAGDSDLSGVGVSCLPLPEQCSWTALEGIIGL